MRAVNTKVGFGRRDRDERHPDAVIETERLCCAGS